jgi:hypothetical protein
MAWTPPRSFAASSAVVKAWVQEAERRGGRHGCYDGRGGLGKGCLPSGLTNRGGRIIERKRLTRGQFERFVDALPAGTEVVMEACGTAHYWGRRCQARGHPVRLLPVQYVQPYVRRNKTDRTDTDALLEAARCEGIQPVPVKTPEQQALQALHRVRTQWQETRTARLNTLRGMLREHGLPIALGDRIGGRDSRELSIEVLHAVFEDLDFLVHEGQRVSHVPRESVVTLLAFAATAFVFFEGIWAPLGVFMLRGSAGRRLRWATWRSTEPSTTEPELTKKGGSRWPSPKCV